MIKSRKGGRWMRGGHRWRSGKKKCYINRHIRFNFLHDTFKGILSFENLGKKENEQQK